MLTGLTLSRLIIWRLLDLPAGPPNRSWICPSEPVRATIERERRRPLCSALEREFWQWRVTETSAFGAIWSTFQVAWWAAPVWSRQGGWGTSCFLALLPPFRRRLWAFHERHPLGTVGHTPLALRDREPFLPHQVLRHLRFRHVRLLLLGERLT